MKLRICAASEAFLETEEGITLGSNTFLRHREALGGRRHDPKTRPPGNGTTARVQSALLPNNQISTHDVRKTALMDGCYPSLVNTPVFRYLIHVDPLMKASKW